MKRFLITLLHLPLPSRLILLLLGAVYVAAALWFFHWNEQQVRTSQQAEMESTLQGFAAIVSLPGTTDRQDCAGADTMLTQYVAADDDILSMRISELRDGGPVVLADSDPATIGMHAHPVGSDPRLHDALRSGTLSAMEAPPDRPEVWMTMVVPLGAASGEHGAMLEAEVASSRLQAPMARHVAKSIILSIVVLVLLVTIVGLVVRNRQLELETGARLKAELALRESESNFRELFHLSPVGISMVGTDGTLLMVNEAFRSILGFGGGDPAGLRFIDFTHPDDRERSLDAFVRLVQGTITSFQDEKRYLTRDGRTVWVQLHVLAVRDGESRLMHFITAISDITDRVVAKAALQRSEHLYRGLFENMLNGFAWCEMLWDDGRPSDFRYLLVNRAFGDLTGLHDVEGRLVSEVIPGIREQDQPLLERYGRVAGEGGTDVFEMHITSLDMWFRVSVYSPTRGFFVAIFDVITQRKRAELALRESERRYRDLLLSSSDWIWEVDSSGVYTYCSETVVDFLGYTPEEVVGRTPFDFIAPDDMEVHRRYFEDVIASRQNIKDLENWNIAKDGSRVCLLTNGFPILDDEGALLGYRGVDKNVTDRKLSEERLRESERFLIMSQAASRIGSYVLDLEKMTWFGSEGLDQVFGLDVSQPNEMHQWLDLLHPGDRDGMQEYFTHCIETVTRFDREYRIIAPDTGETRWVRGMGDYEYGPDGRAVRMIGTIQDITTRHAAEDRIRQLSTAVTQSPLSIIITDRAGSIVYANPKASEVTGYTLEEMLGQNPGILKSGETPEDTVHDLWETIAAGRVWQGEFCNRRKDGRVIWEAASISPIVDASGSIINFLAIKEDITEQKRIIAELEDANRRAEAGSRLKTAFINNISHEVRTPLNGILGFGQMLNDPTLTQEERAGYFEIVNSSANRLLETITNFMDISLLASGTQEVHPSSVLLHALLEDVRAEYADSCRVKGVSLTLIVPDDDAGITISTDPTMLRKVVRHLVSNAVKFTAHGGITFGYEHNGSTIDFHVTDTGKGISEEALHSVFDHFTQEDVSTTRGHEGSGLGLSLARGYVSLLGGDLHVRTMLGVGSTFSFTLPLETLDVMHGVEISPPVHARGRKPHILVAEDDNENYLYVQVLLSSLGCIATRATNGLEAVEICQLRDDIDCVLMDMKMPRLDGFNATARIREAGFTRPIIAITAYAMSGDEERAMEAGCSDYLAKPFRKSQLEARLKHFGVLWT